MLVRLGKLHGHLHGLRHELGITVEARLANATADSELFLNAIAIVFGLAALRWLLSFLTYRWDWSSDF